MLGYKDGKTQLLLSGMRDGEGLVGRSVLYLLCELSVGNTQKPMGPKEADTEATDSFLALAARG